MQFIYPLLFLFFFLFLSFTFGTLVQIFSRMAFPLVDRILYGFAAIFASFYVLAMPFMLLKGSFQILYQLFLFFLMASILTAFILPLVRMKNKPKIMPVNVLPIKIKSELIKTLLPWSVAGALILIQIVATMILQHTDADDSFYIGITTTILDQNRIFTIDPSTGSHLASFPDVYSFTSYEVLMAFFAKLFATNPAILYHSYMPLVVIPFTYLSVFCLSKRITSVDKQPYFMIGFGLLNLFGGYSIYLQSSFLIFRSWQGKAIFVNIFVPLISFLFLDLFISETDRRGRRSVMISIILLAATSMTSVGIFLTPVLVGCLTVAGCIQQRSLRILWQSLVILIPSAFIALLLLLRLYHNQGGIGALPDGLDQLSYLDNLMRFIGGGSYYLLYLVTLLFMFTRNRSNERLLFFISPFVLFLTFLNPFLYPYVARYITNAYLYWRLFWLIPCFPALSLLFAEWISIINRKSMTFILSLVLVILILLAGGKWIINRDNFDYQMNPAEISQDSIDLCHFLSDNEYNEHEYNVVLMAPYPVCTEIRQYTATIELVWARPSTYEVDYQRLYGTDPDPDQPIKLDNTRVNAIALPVDSANIASLVKAGYAEVFLTDNYRLLMKTP